MSRRWAVRLERSEVESLARLRLAEGAEVCERGEEIWVRGETLDEPLARLLRRHPHARRHWVLEDGQLLSPGKRVPLGHLPHGPWTPLRHWLTAVLLPTVAAGRFEPIAPRLVRSTQERPAGVLLTDIAAWLAYGITAPQVRLERWQFAAAGDGRLVVRGVPLPGLPGRPYIDDGGIAVPAGWAWAPPVSAEILRQRFGLAERDLALWHEDQTWERVPGDQFVRATRSAIRHTARALQATPPGENA